MTYAFKVISFQRLHHHNDRTVNSSNTQGSTTMIVVTRARRKRDRKGAIAVLAALFMAIMLAMVAFVVDFGYVVVAQSELQRAADAAAHAAVLEFRLNEEPINAIIAARNVANEYVGDNPVSQSSATVDKNWYNADQDGDVVVGYYDFDTRSMTTGDINGYNAVRVRIRRNSSRNGEIPLFFARVMGHTGIPIEAEATAAIVKDVGGIRGTNERAPFLPITIKKSFWEDQLTNLVDLNSWDPSTENVGSLGDGIPEVRLFPHNTDSSGNFGTINVGASENSTQHLSDVIRNGLTKDHLDFHGGDLSFDSNGELAMSGDTGLSTGIKDDLTAIIGKPAIIPLYSTVSGEGNNANFVIVQFVGVRVMEVVLTGNDKRVTIQPAEVTYKGVVSSQSAPTASGDGSYQVYSPVAIVH